MAGPVKLTPVRNISQTVARVTRVLGGSVRVHERGGVAYDALVASGVSLEWLTPGVEVLIHKESEQTPRIISVYGSVTRQLTPLSTAYSAPTTLVGTSTINALPLTSPIQITGTNGIRVLTNNSTGVISIESTGISDQPIAFTAVTSLGFQYGATIEPDGLGNIQLSKGAFRSQIFNDDGGWDLSPNGQWRFLRRESLRAGPDFTPDRFLWFGKTGVPIVRMQADSVQFGLPGSEAQIHIDMVNGLTIHGQAIEVGTIDAETIGPSLSAYLASIIPDYPMAWAAGDSAQAGVSPWASGLVPNDITTALQMTDALEMWVKGGSNGFDVDTTVFAMDIHGLRIGVGETAIKLNLDGTVEVPADVFVGGTLQAGERVLVGVGTWGVDFHGIAIDGDGAIVALYEDDTYQQDPVNGTYQIKIDATDGAAYFGRGALRIGGDGLTYTEQGDDSRHFITGLNNGTEIWRLGMGTDYWGEFRVLDPNGDPEFATSFSIHGTTGGAWIGSNPQSMALIQFPTISFSTLTGQSGVINADGWEIFAPFAVSGANYRVRVDGLGRWGFNSLSPQALVELSDVAPQLRLVHSPSDRYGTVGMIDTGLTLAASHDIVLDPSTNYVLPARPYSVNIGAPTRKFGALWVGDLMVDTLVAQDVRSDIGGRVLVGSTTELVYDLQIGDTIVYVKHSAAVANDIAYLEARGQVEFIKYTSSYTEVETGVYRYTIQRNLDGSGANQWLAGDAVFNTKQPGTGRWIDLYAFSGMSSPTAYGPTIVGNIRTGTAYNAWAPRWAIGNLATLYGQIDGTFGVAFGDPSAVHLIETDTNGIELYNGATRNGWWKTNGDLVLGPTGAATLYANGTAAFTGNITITGGDGIGNLTDADDFAQAAGDNLVYNGNAQLGNNTNFTTLTYQATGGYSGQPHFKVSSVGGSGRQDYSAAYIQVSPDLIYELSAAFYTELAGTSLYSGLACYDKNQVYLYIQNCWRYGLTYNTTLYENYNGGASCKIVPPSSDWAALLSGNTVCIQFAIQTDYSDLPNHATAVVTAIDKTNAPAYWTLTLNTSSFPAPGSHNAGVAVGVSLAGNTYPYMLASGFVPGTSWQHKSVKLKAQNGVNTAPSDDQLRRGTKYVRFFILPNYNQTDVTHIDAVRLANVGQGALDAAMTATNFLDSTGKMVNVPAPVGQGLYQGSTHMGYYSGSAWTTYIDSNANFYLGGVNGPLTWTAGTSTLMVAGWKADTVSFTKDTGSNSTSSGMAPGDYPFFAGATYANRATAPFRVTPAGALTASSGSIGGFTISTNYLASGNFKLDAANKRLYLNGTNWLQGTGGAYSDSIVSNSSFEVWGNLSADQLFAGDPTTSQNNLGPYGLTAVSASIVGGAAIDIDIFGGARIGGALDHDGSTAGFYNVTPISRPTTSVAAATFTANSGTAVNDASTFDGYTIKQVVKALRNLGLLT